MTRTRFLSHRRLLAASVVLGVIGAAAPAGAQILADSVDDFSGTQGTNGWYYGFFDGLNAATPWALNDFEQLPIFDGLVWRRTPGVGGYWTSITANGGHPNGILSSGGRTPENNWAVRRWVSDGNYVLHVTGRLWDADPTPNHGNGVTGHILVDGSTVWQVSIDNGNQQGVEYALEVCTIPGTIIDFAIDPRDGDDASDDTGFQANIRTIIDVHPQDTLTCEGGTVEFFIVTVPGEFTYQWRHNGEPIMHDGNLSRLRVVGAGDHEHLGAYDCVVTNGCGSMVSDAGILTICHADFDCDGIIDSRDFFVFVETFLTVGPRSDINHDGFIDTQDFFFFIQEFFGGCGQ